VAGALGILILGVAIARAINSRSRQRTVGSSALIALIVMTAVFGVLSILNFGSDITTEPISELARLAALLATYSLAANLFGTVDRATRLIAVVGVSAIVPALFGLHEWIGGVPAPADASNEVGRITGTFSGPNAFGTYLALGTLVLLALPKGVLPAWVRIVGAAAAAAAIVGTYSRAGWIFLLGGIVALGWRTKRVAAIVILLGAVTVVATVPTVQERVLPSAHSQSDEATYESFSWRIDNWEGLLEKWSESPLVGHGVGAVPLVNPRVPPDGEGRFAGGFDAHNLVVKSLVEGGVVYLLTWALFLAVMTAAAFRLARDDWPLRSLARALTILWGLVILLSVSTSEPTSETATMFSLLAIAGALEGAHANWRATQREGHDMPPVPADLGPLPPTDERQTPPRVAMPA
jgi:O-antigen ligase